MYFGIADISGSRESLATHDSGEIFVRFVFTSSFFLCHFLIFLHEFFISIFFSSMLSIRKSLLYVF